MIWILRGIVLFGWVLIAVALFAGAFTDYEPSWIVLCGGGFVALGMAFEKLGKWIMELAQ